MTANPSKIESVLSFGYLTREEFRALVVLASSLPQNARIVNIGAGAGTSALALAIGAPLAERYTVDVSPGGPLGGLEGERNAFEDSGLSQPIQILGDSRKVAADWPHGGLDLVFVDDGHTRIDVTGDITGWLPHVKVGGYIAFHDYGNDVWPDVKEVVDEFFKAPAVQEGFIAAFKVEAPKVISKRGKARRAG